MPLDQLGEAGPLHAQCLALVQTGRWPPAADPGPGTPALGLCGVVAAEAQVPTRVVAVGAMRCWVTSLHPSGG